MAILTIFETAVYRYDYDCQYGTSWYVRLRDDAVSLMNTGIEAEEEKAWAAQLNATDQIDRAVFNSIATEHSFSPRWSEPNGIRRQARLS